MIRTLDTSMLNFPYTFRELAPLAVRYGIQALSVPASMPCPRKKASVPRRNSLLHWKTDHKTLPYKHERKAKKVQ